jgi:hypothetical protein
LSERFDWMTIELEYSSVLTGAAFMFYEFKHVVALKDIGYSDKEIRRKVITENLFQYEKVSSLKRALPSLIKRVNVLDEPQRKFVLDEPFEIGRIINLYAIMKTDRLFFEFMDEVVKEKLQANNYILEKKDINNYFTVKAEQDENIEKWTEKTIQKLKQVYIKILLETGLLKDKQSGEINRLILDEQIKNHLTQIGDARYIRAMGE